MEYFSYKDIYAKNFLNEIKQNIRNNKMKLAGDKEKETDKKMVEVIKGQSDNVIRGATINTNEETERIMCTLMLYYTALYNDNLNILNKLFEIGYDFGSNRKYMKLFALDKRITKHFKIEEYCELLTTQSIIFENFYDSLTKEEPLKALTDEEVINIFCNILNRKPNIAFITKEIKQKYYNPYSNNQLYTGLLTKKTISYFGEDVIINATESQKNNIITELNYSTRTLDKETLDKLIRLMTNHNFQTNMLGAWEKGLKELTEEELIKINEYEENLFSKYLIIGYGTDISAIKKEINGELIKSNPKKRGLKIFRRN